MKRNTIYQSAVVFTPIMFPLDECGIECFNLVGLPQRRDLINSFFDSTELKPVFATFIGKEVVGENLVRLPVCVTELGGSPTSEDVKCARAMEWDNKIIRGWMNWVDTRIKRRFKVGVVIAFHLPHQRSKMGSITLTMEGGLYTQYQRRIATILVESTTGQKK